MGLHLSTKYRRKIHEERCANVDESLDAASHRDSVIGYPDLAEAIDWLCDAFGFTLRLQIGDHRAQLNAGDGAIVLTGHGLADGRQAQSVMVRVDDVDAHHDRARSRGARVLAPPTDHPYGERQYNADDFAGHHWTFSQSIADVDPADWGGTLVQPDTD